MSFYGRLIAPYQHDGVKWLLDHERNKCIKGGFLCDEMGLGKTVQLIATMCFNKKPKTLIIAPKSILTQWRDEIRSFTRRTLSVYVWDGPNRTKDPRSFDAYDVVITSYSLVLRQTPLHAIRWDRLILDEAHEVRTPGTKTHVQVRSIQSNIRWAVTGTPVFNSLRDFVSLGSIVGISKSIIRDHPAIAVKSFVLRRTKEDLGDRLQLPSCKFENVELEMYPNEKKLYDDVYEQSKDTVETLLSERSPGITMYVLECLLRVRQVMVWPQMYLNSIAHKEQKDPESFEGSTCKMDTLVSLIESHPKEKTLVFCQFREEMRVIESRVKQKVFRIDGSVEKDQRERNIAEFKACKDGAVFVIQIKAGGVGLNLTEATRVYITSPAWNPATELQAIARAHRTGQTRTVYIKKLVYKGDTSVEQSIMELQNHKSIVCAEVLNDPRLQNQLPKTKSSQTIKELKKLFR